MAEVEVDMPQVADGLANGETTFNKASEIQASQNGQTDEAPSQTAKASLEPQANMSNESREQAVEVTEKKDNTSVKSVPIPVPVSAHQRDQKGHESLRVKEAKRWNDRDRFRHGRSNNYTPRKPYRNNNKFEPASLPESDDPVAIRKQVEFYFSDSNLLTDKFLFTKTEGHENVPVPVDLIHSFKRMRHFQPRSAIITALKESKFLNLVNDENEIQRKEPLPEGLVGKPMNEIQKVHEDQSMARTIYAKGFGEEEASTQFDIEAFFANYGSTNSVRLRRDADRTFKGSVFVEFDNEETAKTFLALDPAPSYKGNTLLIKSKKQYCDEKVEGIRAGRVRPHSPGTREGRGGFRGGQRNNDHRDLDRHDDRDWRLRREEDAKKGFPERRNGGSKDDNDRRRGNKRKGFGSRGRGGSRGGKGGDRTEERREREERSASSAAQSREATPTQEDKKVEAGDTEIVNVQNANKTTEDQPVTESASKKRTHEDDEEADNQREAKKVDFKGI